MEAEVSDGPASAPPRAASPQHCAPASWGLSGQLEQDQTCTATCYLAGVFLTLQNILPIFSFGGTRGGPGLPSLQHGTRNHICPQRLRRLLKG